jgi:hypothetical protein
MNTEKNAEVETAPPEQVQPIPATDPTDPRDTGEEEEWDNKSDEQQAKEIAQYEAETGKSITDEVPDPEAGDEDVDEGLEKDPEPSDDLGYLENGVEILGFENREEQFRTYEQISQYIEGSSSILDFGCGRGDLFAWWMTTKKERPNYLGVDMNGPLITAGQKVNGDVQLKHMDWFDLPKGDIREWCINVNSFTARADGNIKSDDMQYAKDTIKLMYDRCIEGCVIVLPDTLRGNYPENYMNLSPGALLEFILSDVSPAIAVDHAYAYDLYTIIIYKTEN